MWITLGPCCTCWIMTRAPGAGQPRPELESWAERESWEPFYELLVTGSKEILQIEEGADNIKMMLKHFSHSHDSMKTLTWANIQIWAPMISPLTAALIYWCRIPNFECVRVWELSGTTLAAPGANNNYREAPIRKLFCVDKIEDYFEREKPGTEPDTWKMRGGGVELSRTCKLMRIFTSCHWV